jgi:hypothetical protein
MFFVGSIRVNSVDIPRIVAFGEYDVDFCQSSRRTSGPDFSPIPALPRGDF